MDSGELARLYETKYIFWALSSLITSSIPTELSKNLLFRVQCVRFMGLYLQKWNIILITLFSLVHNDLEIRALHTRKDVVRQWWYHWVLQTGPLMSVFLFHVSYPSFFPSFLVLKLCSLYSSGSFLRSENENKGLCLKSGGRMEVKPIKDQSMCSQAEEEPLPLITTFLWTGWWTAAAALDLCLLYLKGTFLEENVIYYDTVLEENKYKHRDLTK